ncbi:MAG: AI-2E family transporter, partial [Chloroflexi bacterium]|nr:AI-2E family transporter [Chloroflexota bacterium]
MSESQLIPSPTPNSNNDSPQWSRSTKVIVTVVALLLVVWITYRFQSLIGQVVAAAILAYILNPIIIILDKRTPLHRSNAILIMYLLLLIGFIGAVTALGVAAFEQVSTLISAVPTFIEETTELVQSSIATFNPVKIGPIIINPNEFDWNILTDQILGMVEPVVSRSGHIVTDIATTTVGWVGTLFFVFVISIYFAIEIPQLGGYVGRLANQPGYRKDAERLMRNFGSIWSA